MSNLPNIRYENNHYGKGSVRVAKVIKNPDYDDFKDYVVDIQLYGDFEGAYTVPSNKQVIPTDTMKNTVYVLAKTHPMSNPIEFAIDLSKHFLDKFKHVSRASVEITELVWSRVVLSNNKEHSHGFVDKQTHHHKCYVMNDRNELNVKAGIVNLLILKTRGSSFEEYLIDEYTTLQPAHDRIMCTKGNLFWTYDSTYDFKEINHNKIYQDVKRLCVENFVCHDESVSVQHTIDVIGKNVLKSIKEINSIEINLPNVHYSLANLSPFGLDNNNEVFVPSSEPYGNIYAKLAKTDYSIDCFNKLPKEEAIDLLKDISVSKKFTKLIVEKRPYLNVNEIQKQAKEIYSEMNGDDWYEEFEGKARLGNAKSKLFTEEFKEIRNTNEQLRELNQYQTHYEAKFNHIFIISVANKTLEEIISSIKRRLSNDPKTELNECIKELKTIKELRIPKVFKIFGQMMMNKNELMKQNID